jgi:hypothetical protein
LICGIILFPVFINVFSHQEFQIVQDIVRDGVDLLMLVFVGAVHDDFLSGKEQRMVPVARGIGVIF